MSTNDHVTGRLLLNTLTPVWVDARAYFVSIAFTPILSVASGLKNTEPLLYIIAVAPKWVGDKN